MKKFLLVAAAALALAGCSSAAKPADTAAAPAPAAVTSAAPASTPAAAPPAPPADNMTPGQQNALRKAQSYLQFMPFSRTGLIKQLTDFDKFAPDDAGYGVDHAQADWMDQAVKKAQSYLRFQAFSHDGLVKQLVFDGFSPDQAEHGATAAGV